MKSMKLHYTIVVLGIFSFNNLLYSAASNQLSPFTGTNGSIWYDSRTQQMKFNFDYNQYDLLLSQRLEGTAPFGRDIVYGTNSTPNFNSDVYPDLGIVYLSAFPFQPFTAGQSTLAQLCSAHGIDWSSAQETHAIFSCRIVYPSNFPGDQVNVASLQIGIFDLQDGIGLAYGRLNGIDSTIVLRAFIRYDGVTTYFTPNGTAPTDLSKLNIYRFVVTDKATGPIRIEFFNEASNIWTPIHTITNNQSSLNNAQLRTLHLPINVTARFDATTNGNTGNNNFPAALVAVAGMLVETMGDTFETKQRAFSKSVSSTVGSSETHLLTLQNNSTFNLKNNWVAIRIKDFIGYALTSDILSGIYKVYKNATVTGTSFTSVDANNSVVSTSTAGTYTVGTGTEVYAAVISAGTGGVSPFDADDAYILVNPGETLTITSQLPYNSTGNVFTAIRWMEMF